MAGYMYGNTKQQEIREKLNDNRKQESFEKQDTLGFQLYIFSSKNSAFFNNNISINQLLKRTANDGEGPWYSLIVWSGE